MRFVHLGRSGDTRVSGYLLTLFFIILVFAIIGQLPMTIDAILTNKEAVREGASPYDLIQVFGRNKLFFYLLLPFALTFFTVLIAVRYIQKRSWRSVLTSRDRVDWKRYFFAVGLLGLILLSFFGLNLYVNPMLQWNFQPSQFFPLILLAMVLVPLQTAAEEVVIRGFLFQVIGASSKGWVAVLVTACVFGGMHAANPEVQTLGPWVLVYYVVTGLFLGVCVLMDDGLELAMGYHMMNNLFATIVVTNDWQAFRTDALFMDTSPPVFGWDSLLSLVFIQPLLLFIFSKRYKWADWRSRLFG